MIRERAFGEGVDHAPDRLGLFCGALPVAFVLDREVAQAAADEPPRVDALAFALGCRLEPSLVG